MATLDPSIQQGLRPVQIENPLMQYAQLAQVQNAQQTNALLGMKMQQAQREEQDLQSLRTGLSAPGADPYKVLMSTGRVKEAGEYLKSQREADKAKVELVDSKLKQSRAFLDSVKTPEQYLEWHRANHADPILGPELAARGVTQEKALASIQQALQAPGGFEDLLKKSALGIEKFTELNKPTTSVVNAGGTSQVLQTPGLGGAPQAVGSIQHTATPGDLMTDARGRQQLAISAGQLGVAQENLKLRAGELSKPYEVTDPNTGQNVLVQSDKAGNVKPVTGYAPKGGGKALPQAALKTITEARDNALTIDRLTNSFKPDYAGKGVLGFGADTQLSASGVVGADADAVEWWKNYRKQSELVERHSLFGAALTPGEQASWRSADIGPGMNAKTIQKNLDTRKALAAKVLDTTRQDLIDAGHSEQRVNAIAARGPSSTGNTAAPASPQAGALSPAEQKELDDLRKRFKK